MIERNDPVERGEFDGLEIAPRSRYTDDLRFERGRSPSVALSDQPLLPREFIGAFQPDHLALEVFDPLAFVGGEARPSTVVPLSLPHPPAQRFGHAAGFSATDRSPQCGRGGRTGVLRPVVRPAHAVEENTARRPMGSIPSRNEPSDKPSTIQNTTVVISGSHRRICGGQDDEDTCTGRSRDARPAGCHRCSRCVPKCEACHSRSY